MAESNRQYELTFIVSGQLDEPAALAVVDDVRRLIEAAEGKIMADRPWGKRRLEYPISKETSGYYQTLIVELPAEASASLEGKLFHTTGVIRHLLVRFVEPVEKRPVATPRGEQPEILPTVAGEEKGVKLEAALEEILKE